MMHIHDVILLAAEVFLALLCAVLGYSVVTRRLAIAWPISLGVALLTLATLGGLDAILSDRPSLDVYAVAARWLLVGTGVGLIVGCFLWRALFPQKGCPRRRMTDFVSLTTRADIDDAPPDEKPKQRPWYRWRRKTPPLERRGR